MMWVVWAALCAGAGAVQREGALVAALRGARGANRVTMCGERPCDGALWGARWALVPAGCGGGRALVRPADGLTCGDLHTEAGAAHARRVVAEHPYPRMAPDALDLVLLRLDRPYFDLEPVTNDTAIQQLLKPFSAIINSTQRAPVDAWAQRHYNCALLATPLRMFLTTMLLPFITFISLFLFIIYCTGQDKSNQYKSLDKSEDTLA